MPYNEVKFNEEILSRIPLRNEPPLPPNWLYTEMIERFRVLSFAPLKSGVNVLEIGCGPHALATVPLAYMVGVQGLVVAVDKGRWGFFEEVIRHAGVKYRVIPLEADAVRLPFSSKTFGLSVLVHSIRSLKDEETIIKVFSEVLRVSVRVFVAESLPIANNERQRNHLILYNLREEIFEALYGEKDDIHYFPLESLEKFALEAGGIIVEKGVFEPHLPHYLAYIPREYVGKIKDIEKRKDLLSRWDEAYLKWKRGAEHPPVGWLLID